MTTRSNNRSDVGSPGRIQDVDADELASWLRKDQCVLVDVRGPMEHEREAIPGAVNVPLGELDRESLPERSGRRVVLQCNSGNRSTRAAEKLAGEGVENVCNLEGGLAAWKRSNRETRVNRNAPIGIQRQVKITAGSGVLLGVAGSFWSPWFLVLSVFIGAGLVYAGMSGTCGMALALAKMPWNR